MEGGRVQDVAGTGGSAAPPAHAAHHLPRQLWSPLGEDDQPPHAPPPGQPPPGAVEDSQGETRGEGARGEGAQEAGGPTPGTPPSAATSPPQPHDAAQALQGPSPSRVPIGLPDLPATDPELEAYLACSSPSQPAGRRRRAAAAVSKAAARQRSRPASPDAAGRGKRARASSRSPPPSSKRLQPAAGTPGTPPQAPPPRALRGNKRTAAMAMAADSPLQAEPSSPEGGGGLPAETAAASRATRRLRTAGPVAAGSPMDVERGPVQPTPQPPVVEGSGMQAPPVSGHVPPVAAPSVPAHATRSHQREAPLSPFQRALLPHLRDSSLAFNIASRLQDEFEGCTSEQMAKAIGTVADRWPAIWRAHGGVADDSRTAPPILLSRVRDVLEKLTGQTAASWGEAGGRGEDPSQRPRQRQQQPPSTPRQTPARQPSTPGVSRADAAASWRPAGFGAPRPPPAPPNQPDTSSPAPPSPSSTPRTPTVPPPPPPSRSPAFAPSAAIGPSQRTAAPQAEQHAGAGPRRL